ncbi:MAG: hypothetical protein H0X24_21230, partial [Ktedonobacterales bacterium]|nr:hypothetical protein [Ktedonobacterales bacterium]
CAKVPALIIRPEGVPFPDLPRYTPLTIALLFAPPLAQAAMLQPCVRLAQSFDADLLLVGEHSPQAGEDARSYAALSAVAREIEQSGIAVSRMLTHAPVASQLATLVHTQQLAIIALPLPLAGTTAAISTILRDVNAPTLLFHPEAAG